MNIHSAVPELLTRDRLTFLLTTQDTAYITIYLLEIFSLKSDVPLKAHNILQLVLFHFLFHSTVHLQVC